MDPITILTALIPAFSDGAKMAFNKFFGSAQPKTVDDVLKLKGSDVEQMKAIAALDSAGDVHRWVNDVRAMQRPVAVVLVVSAWIYTVVGSVSPETSEIVSNLAASVVFYLFGDRTYLGLKRG